MRKVFILLSLVALVGCGAGEVAATSVSANQTLAGTYILRTIDGKPMPVTLVDGAGLLTVLTGDAIVIAADG